MACAFRRQSNPISQFIWAIKCNKKAIWVRIIHSPRKRTLTSNPYLHIWGRFRLRGPRANRSKRLKAHLAIKLRRLKWTLTQMLRIQELWRHKRKEFSSWSWSKIITLLTIQMRNQNNLKVVVIRKNRIQMEQRARVSMLQKMGRSELVCVIACAVRTWGLWSESRGPKWKAKSLSCHLPSVMSAGNASRP